MNEKDIFDKDSVYDNELMPIIRNLKQTCNLHRIPMFITVAVANDENGTKYRNDAVHAGIKPDLKDDRIAKILLLINGFHEELPEYIKKDIREIQEYADRLSFSSLDEDILGIELTEDLFGGIERVACGDDVRAPEKMLGTPITDEFFDDDEDLL